MVVIAATNIEVIQLGRNEMARNEVEWMQYGDNDDDVDYYAETFIDAVFYIVSSRAVLFTRQLFSVFSNLFPFVTNHLTACDFEIQC